MRFLIGSMSTVKHPNCPAACRVAMREQMVNWLHTEILHVWHVRLWHVRVHRRTLIPAGALSASWSTAP